MLYLVHSIKKFLRQPFRPLVGTLVGTYVTYMEYLNACLDTSIKWKNQKIVYIQLYISITDIPELQEFILSFSLIFGTIFRGFLFGCTNMVVIVIFPANLSKDGVML